MAMKKSISRTLAHIDVAATVPFAFTKTFSTPTGFITTYLVLRCWYEEYFAAERYGASLESFCVTAEAVTYKASSCPFVQF